MKKIILSIVIIAAIFFIWKYVVSEKNSKPITFQIQERTVILNKTSLLSDKINVMLPDAFAPLSKLEAKSKYIFMSVPDLIYGDPNSSAILAFEQSDNELTDRDMPSYLQGTVANIIVDNGDIILEKASIIKNKWKNIGFIESKINNGNKDLYCLMFFVEVEGTALQVVFTCDIKEQKDWELIAKRIMSTFEENEK